SVTFRITAANPVSFPLHIRIPSWSGAVTVTAPGATVSATADLRILRKEWQTGDSVTVAFENPVTTGVCTNGEITVNRGPLLYALQWAATTNVLVKSRANTAGFTEWELIPENPQTKSGYFIEHTSPTGGFQAQTNADYDPANPWAHPRTVLTGEMRTVKLDPNSKQPVTLVPMGSALLRFAAFPPVNIITNTATFDGGGGTNGSWQAKENWTNDTVPLFTDTLDVYFTGGGTNWIGYGSTIRSLNFTDTVDANFNLRNLATSGAGAQTLIFGGDGGAAIHVASGATGKIIIGQAANGGSISLAEDLSVNHNGSGILYFSKPVTGSGGIIKNGSGTLILNSNDTNDYTGATVVNAGTLTGSTNYVFAGTTNITVAGGAVLTLGATSCIGDQTKLVLATNAILNLGFTGADTVGGISLNGGTTWLTNGIYNAATLNALGAGTYTGSGNLLVGLYILTGGNGTVTSASANVYSGSNATFTVAAARYYRIVSLTTNGTPAAGMFFDNNSTSTNFTRNDLQAGGTLSATFTAQVTADPASTPYSWLAQYGLTNYDADAAADADHDGLLTWQEYIAGTNPTNPASAFRITATNMLVKGKTVIRWSSASNRFYSLSRTTNLMTGFNALAGASNLPATPPENVYTNPVPDGAAAFYRINVHQ
ncbi:MAG: autotransporter-associated beta strand repeat-containing protein, partial [Kiritimatiellales bacterium]